MTYLNLLLFIKKNHKRPPCNPEDKFKYSVQEGAKPSITTKHL